PWWPSQSADRSGWEQLDRLGGGRLPKPDWNQPDPGPLRDRIKRYYARNPLSLVALIGLLFFVALIAWESAPWTLAHHAAVYRLLQAELAAFPAPYPSSTQDGRIDLTGAGPLDHGPTIELQYYFVEGRCADVQAYYAQAASAAGWSPTKRNDYGDDTDFHYS